MTRASVDQQKQTPWFAKAGAATSIVPIARFVGPHTFATKNGDYGVVFRIAGVDPESLTEEELDAKVYGIESVLHGLAEGFCLYQYTLIRRGCEIPRVPAYPNPVTERFMSDRLEHLRDTANFRRLDIYWCLILEAPSVAAFELRPKQQSADVSRRQSELQKATSVLEATLTHSIGLELLGKDAAFKFFSYLFNLEEWAEKDELQGDADVDFQLVRTTVRWEAEHLRVGKRFARAFCLKTTPEASRPCLFADVLKLDGDAVLCSTWRPRSTSAARREIDQQEKFTSFFKIGVLSRVASSRDAASLETTAGAKAASFVVDDLSDAIRGLDKKTQGLFTLTLLVVADSATELQGVAPSVHRIFGEARAYVMEETLGNLSAFYALFPGNQKFQVFSMWLGEEHHARLASVFLPHLGHVHSEDLDAEYLNVFETRSGTPFFQDAYVGGVHVSLTLGPTGSGKSVHQNQAIALEQKYGGFTYIFDIGGSYESVVDLYGGKVDRVGTTGPRVNPFALEPTEANTKFLHSFVKLLLTSGGAALAPEDDDTVYKAVQDIYHLDPLNRRLSALFLPLHLQRFLGKWTGSGLYASIFDNVEDELSLTRLQCFDFQGVNNKQYADLIEPLMVWLLRRIEDVLYDPANLGVPKHIVIEELFSSMKNKQLLDAALASIKTVRKNLGGVTLIGQSARDLGENADSIVNSCTSFLFLPDATFNREHYRKLFSLTDHQIALFESLQSREALYVRRDGITKVIRLNLDARSYAAFTTKPKDRARRARLIARYGLEQGIERFARGEDASTS